METNEIKKILMNTLDLNEVYVSNNGNHFQIIAISNIFNNMSQVKKHQIIYEPLMKYISENRIHALSIKTYSLEEWKLNYKF